MAADHELTSLTQNETILNIIVTSVCDQEEKKIVETELSRWKKASQT